MRNVLFVLLAIVLAYALFVAFNTYIYAQKQEEGVSVEIQWGF